MTPRAAHRPIPSAPGYVATADGRILSRSGWHGFAEREVAQSMSGTKRYPAVTLFVEGRRVTRSVHVLIAEAFHGQRPDGWHTRHLNGVRTDNRAENLAYGSARQNAADRVAHGTAPIGERHPRARLTETAVVELRDRYAAGGVTLRELALERGMSMQAVHHVIRRRTWAHVA